MFTIIRTFAQFTWFTLIPLHIMLSSTVSRNKEYNVVCTLAVFKKYFSGKREEYGDVWITTCHFFTINHLAFFLFRFLYYGLSIYQNSKGGKKNKVRENWATKLRLLCVILTLQALWQKSKTSYKVQIVSVSHAGHLLPPVFSNHTTRSD